MDYFVLREFDYLKEHEQPAYLIKHGNFLVTNSATFPAIPYSGIIMKADGVNLNNLLAMKDVGEVELAAYSAHLELCKGKMLSNYNDIDLVSNGSSTIIALAGVNSYGGAYARTGVPGAFGDIQYVVSNIANQIKIEWIADDLAYGSIMITATDPTLTVVRTGPLQLKINVKDIIIMVDLTTKANVVIENLVGGTVVKSSGVSFNPNGMNPLVNMKPIVVPLP